MRYIERNDRKMGLFGNQFMKEGPGVDKNGPKKKRFFFFFELFFRKFWKLVELNLVFAVFCVPAALALVYMVNNWARAGVTGMILLLGLFLVACIPVGPAMAGVAYILRNYVQERPVFMLSDFWDSFKSNLRQSMAIFYLDLIVTGICTVSFIWYFSNSGMSWAMMLPLALCITLEIILMFMRFYTYLMVVTVDLPVKHIIKNSAIFSILGLKTNIITLFFVLLIAVPIVWYLPLSATILAVIGAVLIGFIVTFNSFPYLVKYIIDPHDRQMRAERGEDEDDDEDEDDEPIFTDMGRREVEEQAAPQQGKQKVIR